MFDDMNDNKNFNNNLSNGKDNFSSLFFNNSEDVNYNAPLEDNFIGPTQLNNMFNVENNIENPQIYSNYNNINQNDFNKNIIENNDLPPMLDEITYLNKESAISAPSMSSLEQVNVLENYENKDKLEEYEKGNFYQSNWNNIDMNNDFKMPNNELEKTPYDLPLSSFNTDINDNLQENENQSLYQTKLNEINVGENFDISTADAIEQKSYDLQNIIGDNKVFDLEKNSLLNGDKEINNENKEEYKIIQQDINLNENSESNNSIDSSDTTDENKKDINLNEEYVIIQDEKLSDESSNLLDDYNIYDEPDILEIMDLDSDMLLKEDTKEQKISETSTFDNIEKIKELVEQLKLTGTKIEMEEFDFEEMYQLIIKLEK